MAILYFISDAIRIPDIKKSFGMCIIFTTLYFFCLQKDDVPLFLGGDILAASAQSSKNYCRIHSRYGKDGYATKLTFRGKSIC